MRHSIFTFGAMLAATFALSSCDDSVAIEQTPSKGIPFEISTLLTKTTNDGLATNWAADDAINLFHAEAGSTSYTSDGKFTVDEALTGKFSGTLAKELEDGKSYDWYAFYPYSSHITTPANTSGYTYIGGRSDTPQAQTGNDNKAHLAGTACPLYGVVKDLASDVKPAIAMKHAASVVAIKVTNTLAEELTVNSISFTSTKNIVGQFYIDFSSDSAEYKDGSYVSSTANLTVTGGEAIAQKASAVFYIAVKPHTAASGSTLKISVNGAEKTLTLPKDVTFTAGSIKTLEYKYDYVPAAEETTVTKSMNDIVEANSYTISEGTNIGTTKSTLQIDEVITLSSTGSGNTGSFWKNKTTEVIDWRCYQNGSTGVIKVAATDGYTIKKLTFTFTVGNSGTLTGDSGKITSGTSYEINAQDVSYTIGTTGKKNGQIRITAISVTYVKN